MSRQRTGRYSGNATLTIGDREISVDADLTGWMTVHDGGVTGLGDWGGVLAGSGNFDVVTAGGPYTLRLADGSEGSVVVQRFSPQGAEWTAVVVGSGEPPAPLAKDRP